MEERITKPAEPAQTDETAEQEIPAKRTEKAEGTAEDVSRETEFAENPKKLSETEKISDTGEASATNEPSALWSAEYTLTEAEMKQFVEHCGVIASKRKTVIQGSIAAVLCLINAVAYATGGSKMTLFLAVLCAALCGLVFVTPHLTRRNLLEMMKTAAKQGRPTRLSSKGDGLTFQAGDGQVSYLYEEVTIKCFGDIVTVALPDNQMVCVPARAVSSEAWEELCARIKDA